MFTGVHPTLTAIIDIFRKDVLYNLVMTFWIGVKVLLTQSVTPRKKEGGQPGSWDDAYGRTFRHRPESLGIWGFWFVLFTEHAALEVSVSHTSHCW